VHTHTPLCTHTHACTHTHPYAHTLMHAHTHPYAHTLMHIHTHPYAHTLMRAHTNPYAHTLMRAHTHTHTTGLTPQCVCHLKGPFFPEASLTTLILATLLFPYTHLYILLPYCTLSTWYLNIFSFVPIFLFNSILGSKSIREEI
jgi:hypothetical protein